MRLIAAVLTPLCLAACGGTVAHSEPVSVKIGAIKEGDLRGRAFDMDKSIDGDSDKPYKAFLDAARLELDGEDPESILVDAIVLTVASDSKGIGTDGFGLVVERLEVYLAKGETTVVIGDLDDVPDDTTVEVDVDASEDDLRVLRPDLLKGDFKVGIRGDARDDRPTTDYELKTNAQLTFRATGS